MNKRHRSPGRRRSQPDDGERTFTSKPTGRQRRGLSHLGGAVTLCGDKKRAHELAWALETGEDEGRDLTHGFHPYPARMHPLTARRVVAARVTAPAKDAPPATVVDPFCGSGAVAVETVRAGLAFVGSDISPVALEIAWLRTRCWSPTICKKLVAGATKIVRLASELAREHRPPPPEMEAELRWYDPSAFRDVLALRDVIREEHDADARRAMGMILSSILVKVSRQVSDATTVIDRNHMPVRAGTALRLFERRAVEVAEQLASLRQDLHEHNIHRIEPKLMLKDAREAGLVPPGTAALALSSPPYLGTYDYLFHHARRYAMLGLPSEYADRREIGARRRVNRHPGGAVVIYEKDLAAALGRMKEAIRPEASIVLLLGDGLIGRTVVRADELIRRITPPLGLTVAAVATQRRPNWLSGKGSPQRAEHLIELTR